ncbi:MAG: hypothetical protein HFJ32_03540 [Clostridia bacterium]|nr:hypothetical protein [Clostridia bacterium]
MTFDLRDPAIIHRIIEAADPQNFDYKEHYKLSSQQQTFIITDSIRTLTILAISAKPFNLYTDLFKDWMVKATTPLTFHRLMDNASVVFCSDWTIQVHSCVKGGKVLAVSKSDVFEHLKSHLTLRM